MGATYEAPLPIAAEVDLRYFGHSHTIPSNRSEVSHGDKTHEIFCFDPHVVLRNMIHPVTG